MSTADEIAKLAALRQSGALSDAEFEAEKAKLLAGAPPPRFQPSPAPAASTPAKSAKPKGKAGVGCLTIIVLAAIVGVIIAATSGSSGPSAHVTGKVTETKALTPSLVRFYIRWTNTGKGSGSASCVLNTNVYNAFGDEVNTEVNSIGTNGNLKPGATQLLYADFGVNNGDASRVKPSDTSIVDC
jgi:hypothetical protein